LRDIVDVNNESPRTGCAGRFLPFDLAPWRTVLVYDAGWRHGALIDPVHDALREEDCAAAGRNEQPSAAIFDRHSARSAVPVYETRQDARKETMDRMRHKLVCAMGLAHGGSSNAPSNGGPDEAPFRGM
jgi:transposase